MIDTTQQLIGKELQEGWIVIKRLERADGATGGCYADCFLVRHKDGHEAFLKAIDFAEALRHDDPSRELEKIAKAFNFERDLLAACKLRRLDHVVTAIGDGKINDLSLPVQYLLFELADGDVRSFSSAYDGFDPAWSLRALHQITIGLRQLHKINIAHQDVKPSNVLVFNKSFRKLADLGRAACQGMQPPHHEDEVAGDQVYAPPELLYHDIATDWNQRRFGCDAYLLGSMVMFFFVGEPMTADLFSELEPSLNWLNWQGTYRQALPYIRDAFNRVVDRFESSVDPKWSKELTPIVRQLCEPDPLLRGHPMNRARGGNSFELERYISIFDRMAFHAEFLSRKEKG